MIDDGHIIVFRDNIFANTFGNIRISIFGMQFAGFMIFLQDGSVSVYPKDFYIWIFFFKKHSTTGDGASRSCAYNEMSESSARLFPDFMSGFFIMTLSVRKVGILVHVRRVFRF